MHKKSTVISNQTVYDSSLTDPILLRVGGDGVTKSEFEAIYHKNNNKEELTREDLNEYLGLFINFKLKVKAAREEGKDTLSAFKNELKGYRRQLAQPYLTDKDVNEKLIEEAYDRMKTDIRASHILFMLSPDALPKDTLAVYNKALSVREKLLKGEDFETMARKYSEDPSATQNGGDLGYFTSMMMVYPFETAAYNTKVGEISMPVRTRFGYHLVKVTDKRPNQGQVRVAHIMVKVNEKDNDTTIAKAESKINEIYSKLKAGEDFGLLASQFSDDRTSGKNGGQLPWFGTGKMVPEFEKIAFALSKEGDLSKPFRSSYGWHVVKLLEKKGQPSFDEMKAELKQKVAKDSRSEVSKDAVIARIKKENNFSEDYKALEQLIAKVDTNYLNGTWKSATAESMNKKLFQLGAEVTTQKDFAEFLGQNQTKQAKDQKVEALVRKAYEYYKEQQIIAYEDARLEQKYPEFRLLMQEYRDGILLFEITDENVWSKALKDTAGLEGFYEKNKNNYMWDTRVDAVIYKAADAKVAKAARKLVAKRESKNMSVEEIKNKINKKSQLNLQTEDGRFVKGENETVDAVEWKKGLSADKINEDGTITFVEITDVVAPTPKSISEARGLITADYQNFLEQEWIKALKEKYEVEIYKDVLETVK
ncbi:MAG: peptidylprolyl isomerase [Bacteroidetes bacterium]|nr:peptidylprolyl isomerase [Bacteroidota bacterium]